MAMVVITGPFPPLRERVALSRAMVLAADTGRLPSGFATNDSYTYGGDIIFPMSESTTGARGGSPHCDVCRHARIRGDRFSAASSMKAWTLATRSSGSGVMPSRIMALDQS